MKAKEYLNRAYKTELQVNTKLEQLEKLRSLAERTTTTLSKTPKGDLKKDTTENILAKIMELEDEIKSDIEVLLDIKTDVQTAIKTVDDPRLRLVLELRYLCYYSWQDIADKINYDVRQVHRFHGEALLRIKPQKRKDVTKCH